MIGTVTRRTAAMAAALALAVAPAAAASARPAKAPQEKQAACVIAFFQYKSLKGARWCHATRGDSNLSGNHYDGSSKSLDNSISSVYSGAGGCTLHLYQYANYRGAHTAYRTPVKDTSLANNKVGDNRTSSWKLSC